MLSENFNLLGPATPLHFSSTIGTQNTIPGLASWDGVKFAGTGATNMNFVEDSGTAVSGAIYSYGNVAGDGERALGTIASGSNTPAFGVQIVNNSAFTMGAFTISFTAEQWRSADAAINSLAFAYGVSGGAIDATNYLTSGSMTLGSTLNAPGSALAMPNGATNGNDAANQTAVMATISGISVPVGQSLFIRWADFNDAGNDAGIAIDNWTFNANPIGASLNWNGGAGGNSTNWNTTGANTNWLNGVTPVAFANNDVGNFTQAGIASGSNVTVDAGGVSPGAMNVSNTSGTYTFSGGAIGGNGALTKTGAGSLVLSNANTYTGGTNINGGIVSVSNDNNLGAAAGAIALGGGTLRTTAGITSARAINLTASTTSTINTNGFNSSTSGAVGGGGDLIKTGAGNLTLTGPFNAAPTSGLVSVTGGSLILGQTPPSTVNLKTGGGGTDWTGNLVINQGIRVNFNGGNFSGGGNIQVQSTNTLLSTDGTPPGGLSSTIGNNIMLNSNSVGGPFATTLGATAANTVIVNGVISGNSDLSFNSSTPGNGTGIVILNNNNTYTGASSITFANAGVVRLGTNNALPTTTDLTFGTGALSPGALDLAGFNQSIKSLKTDTSGVVNGVANSTQTMSTLTITGAATTTYAGPIGIPANNINFPDVSDKISLVLSSAHTGQLTLSGANTYDGNTVIQGGRLVVKNDGTTSAWGPIFDKAGADIQSGRLVFDYTGTTSPAAQVLAILDAGFDQVPKFSSGKLRSSAVTAQTGLGWIVNTATSQVTVGRVRYGDASLDGLVNLVDFNILAGNFGTGTIWGQGDFNYDGVVNLTDFNFLASNFGLTAGPDGPTPEDWASLAAVVPEPSMLGLLTAASLLAFRRRNR